MTVRQQRISSEKNSSEHIKGISQVTDGLQVLITSLSLQINAWYNIKDIKAININKSNFATPLHHIWKKTLLNLQTHSISHGHAFSKTCTITPPECQSPLVWFLYLCSFSVSPGSPVCWPFLLSILGIVNSFSRRLFSLQNTTFASVFILLVSGVAQSSLSRVWGLWRIPGANFSQSWISDRERLS